MISGNSSNGCITNGEHNLREATSLRGISKVGVGTDEAAGVRAGLGLEAGLSVGTIDRVGTRGVASGKGIIEADDPEVELQAEDEINNNKADKLTQARIGLIINQSCWRKIFQKSVVRL